MLAFITSLRHPLNSADYTTEEFVVIVVGNQAPKFSLPERVRFVRVDFPPPSTHKGPVTPREGFVRDKGTKIGVGLAAARAYAPDFAMIFDADDFVHRDLARFATEHVGGDGWVIDRGYVYSGTRHTYRTLDSFNRACGTCHVVRYGVYGAPGSFSLNATQDEVERAYGERLPRILGAHRDAMQWFFNNGIRLEPLPFRGAVYHVDTGENHSGNQMRGIARPLRPILGETFGIPHGQSAIRDVWSAAGPRAVAQSVRAHLQRARGPRSSEAGQT
jgi:hypothetical protein